MVDEICPTCGAEFPGDPLECDECEYLWGHYDPRVSRSRLAASATWIVWLGVVLVIAVAAGVALLSGAP